VVYSASNRNEYQKHKKKCFWGVKHGWCVGLTTLPPSVSRPSRQCGILNISQPYRPPQPVTGIALLYSLCTRVKNTIRSRHNDWCAIAQQFACSSILNISCSEMGVVRPETEQKAALKSVCIKWQNDIFIERLWCGYSVGLCIQYFDRDSDSSSSNNCLEGSEV
jgi:hypothetical protein